jgi:hypothetical protein
VLEPRINAFEIHEWIHEKLQLEEADVEMIQIDGPRRRVYTKFTTNTLMYTVLNETQGRLEFNNENGERSRVNEEIAGMGVKKVRIAILPTEVSDDTLRAALTPYGVLSITEE